MSPFYAVYGREPNDMCIYMKGDTNLVELEDLLLEREAILANLFTHLYHAQTKMKEQADLHRKEVEFSEGDMVFLKVQPYKQKSLAKYKFQKLAPRYFGPYEVIKKISPVAYELKLPSTAKVHPIFHVSLLKRAQGYSATEDISPLPVTDSWEFLLEPESVQDVRVTTLQGIPEIELLIKWKNRDSEENSWENYDTIAAQFPNFSLEDKAVLQGEVMIRISHCWFILGRGKQLNVAVCCVNRYCCVICYLLMSILF